MRKLTATCLAGVATLLLAPAASAAPIIGGATGVTLTAAQTFENLGLGFTNYGTSSVTMNGMGDPVVTFLVTGGMRDDVTKALLVEHAGSGLNFMAGSDMLQIGDFEIDTAAGLVRGTAMANGTSLGIVPLFTLGSDMSLMLTSEAAGAFTSVFGAPDLSGATIGRADVNVVFGASGVPEPASWALMIGGFAIVGAAVRRRRPAQQALA